MLYKDYACIAILGTRVSTDIKHKENIMISSFYTRKGEWPKG